MKLITDLGYEAEHVIIRDSDTFHDQVELMSRAGVFVAVHGAGLMNQIFLAPGSAVIEVFPVHVKHVLYERVAHYAGVYHFKVYSHAFEDGFHKRHPQYRDKNCDSRVDSLDVPSDGSCWTLVKNSNVMVPLPEFRTALIESLDFIKRFKDPEKDEKDGYDR